MKITLILPSIRMLRGVKVVSKEHDVKLVMFGFRKGKDVAEYIESHENPMTNELRKLYNSCDIFSSRTYCSSDQGTLPINPSERGDSLADG